MEGSLEATKRKTGSVPWRFHSCLELLSCHELGSTVSVHFSIMILTFLAHIFPPPSLRLDSLSLTWCLGVDLCIWFCQLLDESSMMVVGVFTNLIIWESHPYVGDSGEAWTI